MSIFNRFPYIVIEGPIGCGKTTLAQILADKFPVDYLSEKAETNPFLPRFYQDAQRYALPTQLFFLFQLCSLKNPVLLIILKIITPPLCSCKIKNIDV